jgi:hypothetical protein
VKHSGEFKVFGNLVGQLLTIPHEGMERRETACRKPADANPKKRGPLKRF